MDLAVAKSIEQRLSIDLYLAQIDSAKQNIECNASLEDFHCTTADTLVIGSTY
jgi:hypothetical protein